MDSLSHVSDGLFSVRNALFCLGAVTWTSMSFSSFSSQMNELISDTEQMTSVLKVMLAFQSSVSSSPQYMKGLIQLFGCHPLRFNWA